LKEKGDKTMEKCLNIPVQDVRDVVHDVQDLKKWLGQVRTLDSLINAKLAERSQVMDLATKITADVTGMPRGNGVSDKVGSAAGRLVDLTKEIDALVDSYVDHKKLVNEILGNLPPIEYGVLHRYYIQGMTDEEVASDMGYCAVHIWRIKKRALDMLLNVILYL
jgi:hypothetical protein